MAKKATKKVVAKPSKKPVKPAVATSKKGEGAKLAAKKQEVSKKATHAKSPKTKEATSSKAPIAPSTKKIGPTPAPEKETTTQPQKTSEVVKNEGPKKKTKTPVPEAVETQEVVAQELEVKDEVSSRKAKKYEGATEEETKWLELRDKNRNIKPRPYKMSEVYLEKTPIEHKVLGWGFVLSVVNDRLEVLFRSGIKHLISNYKTNS